MARTHLDGKEYGEVASKAITRRELVIKPELKSGNSLEFFTLGPGAGLLFAGLSSEIGMPDSQRLRILYQDQTVNVEAEKAIIGDDVYDATVTSSQVDGTHGLLARLSYIVAYGKSGNDEGRAFLLQLVAAVYNPFDSKSIRIASRRHGPGAYDLAVGFHGSGDLTTSDVLCFNPAGVLNGAMQYTNSRGRRIPDNVLPNMANYYLGTRYPRLDIPKTLDKIICAITARQEQEPAHGKSA